MTSVLFRFPAGSYHATPWGHHVNEGLVEWPPSPWRILRALLATGFAKLGWTEVPAEGRELIERLASVLPVYRLPTGVAAHTRHYMPLRSGKTTLVIDAFVRVAPGAALGVTWPIALPSGSITLLGELAARMGYLGRAESIVTAGLAGEEELPHVEETRADASNAPGRESISLLAPVSAGEYAAWRSESAPPPSEPGKRKRKTNGTSDPYPTDLLDALLRDTGWLQEHGWSDPPGSRHVLYWRPADILESRNAAPKPVRHRGVRVDCALLALASDTTLGEVLPPLSRALPQAELLHRALVSQIDGEQCPALTGKDDSGAPLQGHRHAHYVPLDLDADGHLDHFLVYSPMGLDIVAQGALNCVRRTWTKGGQDLRLTLAGLGIRSDFARIGGLPIPELESARTWRSRTPFVPPRYLKARRHTLEDQVQAELRTRGLPEAVRIEACEPREQRFYRFVRARRDRARAPPLPCFFDLTIELSAPVSGPLTLGYASHLGLGLFIPEGATAGE